MEVFNFKRGASYHLTNTKEKNYVWRQGPWTGTQDCVPSSTLCTFFLLFSVLSFLYLIYLAFKFFRVEALPCTMKLWGPDFHSEYSGYSDNWKELKKSSCHWLIVGNRQITGPLMQNHS